MAGTCSGFMLLDEGGHGVDEGVQVLVDRIVVGMVNARHGNGLSEHHSHRNLNHQQARRFILQLAQYEATAVTPLYRLRPCSVMRRVQSKYLKPVAKHH